MVHAATIELLWLFTFPGFGHCCCPDQPPPAQDVSKKVIWCVSIALGPYSSSLSIVYLAYSRPHSPTALTGERQVLCKVAAERRRLRKKSRPGVVRMQLSSEVVFPSILSDIAHTAAWRSSLDGPTYGSVNSYGHHQTPSQVVGFSTGLF